MLAPMRRVPLLSKLRAPPHFVEHRNDVRAEGSISSGIGQIQRWRAVKQRDTIVFFPTPILQS
jgi:hypothetical protein